VIVQKFGGTSVSSPAKLLGILDIISQNDARFVVVSAFSGTTDRLYEMAKLIISRQKSKAFQLIYELKREYLSYIYTLFPEIKWRKKAQEAILELTDSLTKIYMENAGKEDVKSIVAFGEFVSTSVLHLFLKSVGKKSVLLNSLQLFRKDEKGNPDLSYTKSEIESILYQNSDVDVFILQGFICRNHEGNVDNFERGGSDYTATMLGNAINATQIQIWTDINGLHNNDPRHVENTYTINELSYREASELAFFGAKILHPRCIWPAEQKNIPIVLKNTFEPQYQGTVISSKAKKNSIKAVAAKDGVTAIKIRSAGMFMTYGFLSKVFAVFEKYKTAIDMITTSEISVSLTIDNTRRLALIVEELKNYGEIELIKNQSILCVVGDFLAEKKGLSGMILKSIKEVPVRMISYGGSENNISLLIKTEDKKRALRLMQKEIFSEKKENAKSVFSIQPL